MRKMLAEVGCALLMRAEAGMGVGPSELGEVLDHAGLTDSEQEDCLLVVRNCAERYWELRGALASKGKMEILRSLPDADEAILRMIDEDSAELEVGPFSYNLRIPRRKLPLFITGTDDGEPGRAFTKNVLYPWSYIVIERVSGPPELDRPREASPSGSLTDRRPTIGVVAQHEDMHQFETFLDSVWNNTGLDDRPCYEAMRLEYSIRWKTEMGVPSDRLVAEGELLHRMLKRLLPQYHNDLRMLRVRAHDEALDIMKERLKSEMLAFLWSGEFWGSEQRLRHYYIDKWILADEKVFAARLTDERRLLEELLSYARGVLADQRRQLRAMGNSRWMEAQLAMMKGDDVPLEDRMVAMMNIDLPLKDWGDWRE